MIQEEFISEFYSCDNEEEALKRLYSKFCCLKEENQELNQQLEEINNFINKAGFINIQQLMLDYCARVEQQKEFIEWLENKMKETHYVIFEFQAYRLAFEKFKEIIGE